MPTKLEKLQARQRKLAEEQDKPKVEFENPVDPKRKDCFWFDDLVATVTRYDNTVYIIASGEIEVGFGDPNHDSFEWMNGDDGRAYAKEHGYTDRKIKGDKVHFECSNWFAFRFPITRYDNEEDTDHEIELAHTCTDLDEAVEYAKSVLMDLCAHIKF